jgi:hypothetical protein
MYKVDDEKLSEPRKLSGFTVDIWRLTLSSNMKPGKTKSRCISPA